MTMQLESRKSLTPRLMTIRDAANTIGLEYRQLLSAANEGLVPIYRLRKSRRLVNLEEVISLMRSPITSK